MTEDDIQRAVVKWLTLKENQGALTFFHPPNGGKRGKAEGGRFKALGVRAGVPDLCILFPTGRSLFIELKTQKGSVSPSQKYWLDRLNELGHRAVVCRSLDDVMGEVM